MDPPPNNVLEMILLGAAAASLALLVLLTLLPLAPSGEWWVRIWDFPRLQIVVLLLVPLALTLEHARRTGFQWEHGALVLVALVAAVWQVCHVIPFTPLWPREVPPSSADGPALQLLSANLDFENDRHADVLAMIRQRDADLVFVVEIDEAWAEALAPLDDLYPHRHGVVRGEGLGMVLWSRFALTDSDVKHLVSERRPSLFATVDVPGVGPVRFVGVHPTPPGLRDDTADKGGDDEGRHDSRVRDAELVLVAREVRADPDQRWVVAGDFNDVAWSHTTRLFQDLSDLKDPRRGRSLMNTYHADWPMWRYPIDHVFVSDGWRLASMDRVPTPGSDHFAITATLAVAAKDEAAPDASAKDKEEAEAIVEEGKEDAAERETAAPE